MKYRIDTDGMVVIVTAKPLSKKALKRLAKRHRTA